MRLFIEECVRDYVHVTDLAKAHLLGLSRGRTENSGFSAYNLGNGFSVLEVIKATEMIVDQKMDYKITTKRDGDPSVLVADSLPG